MSITTTQTSGSEIVLTERKVTTEYRINRIEEDILVRKVQVQIELGPFVSYVRPDNQTEIRGEGGFRYLMVWEGDEYDSIRDSWSNSDLIAAVAAKMA